MILKKVLFYGALAAFAAAWGSTVESRSVQRVAVLPFKTNAKKDLAYLREGASVALSTRVGRFHDLEVIPMRAVTQLLGTAAAPSSDADARKIGRLLNADYVLFGSVTVIETSISIDSRLVAVSVDRPTVTFSAHADESAGFFPQLGLMAQEIHAALTDRARADAESRPPAPSRPLPAPSPADSQVAQTGPSEKRAALSEKNPTFPVSQTPGSAAVQTADRSLPTVDTRAPAPAAFPPQTATAATSASVPPPATPPQPADQVAQHPKAPQRGVAGHTIQVAAVRTEAVANAMLTKLRALGYEARIETADLPGMGRWLRLRIGSFSTREEAEPLMQKLKSEGYAPMLFPEQPARFPSPRPFP